MKSTYPNLLLVHIRRKIRYDDLVGGWANNGLAVDSGCCTSTGSGSVSISENLTFGSSTTVRAATRASLGAGSNDLEE